MPAGPWTPTGAVITPQAVVTQWVIFFELRWFPDPIHSAAMQTSVLELFSRRFRGRNALKNGMHEYAVTPCLHVAVTTLSPSPLLLPLISIAIQPNLF